MLFPKDCFLQLLPEEGYPEAKTAKEPQRQDFRRIFFLKRHLPDIAVFSCFIGLKRKKCHHLLLLGCEFIRIVRCLWLNEALAQVLQESNERRASLVHKYFRSASVSAEVLNESRTGDYGTSFDTKLLSHDPLQCIPYIRWVAGGVARCKLVVI